MCRSLPLIHLVLQATLVNPSGARDWEGLCCYPHHSLLSSADVGDSWTYSILEVRATTVGDTTRIDSQYSTQTIEVVRSAPMGDRTYLELSDSEHLYRVDEAGRTWQYDTGTDTEKVFWDIDDQCEPREPSATDGYCGVEAGVVIAGAPIQMLLLRLYRRGPLGRDEWDTSLGPAWWRKRAGRLQGSELWDGVKDLYEYHLQMPELSSYSLVAPGVGVLFCGYWLGWPHRGGGREYYLESHSSQLSTSVRDVSFGQLKEEVVRPVSERRAKK